MDNLVKVLRIILIVFFVLWVVIWFSIRSFKIIEKGGGDESSVSGLVVGLYETPYLIKKYFKRSLQAVKVERNKDLFVIGELSGLNNDYDSVYILHQKYIDSKSTEILLQNIKTGEIDRTWNISLEMIMNDLDSISNDFEEKSLNGIGPKKLNVLLPKSPDNIIIRHSLFLDDGSLIFKPQYLGFIYKIDKNSKLLWKSKKLAHHSIELDENGDIWTCSVDIENETANNLNYREDAILCLDQDGNQKFFATLTDVFQENDLFKSIIEATPVHVNEAGSDPYHLNDVQPVNSNGSFWEKGDVFLSLRHKSLIAQYRPRTGKIIWFQQGPWNMQHDINIENDSIISFFNNNVSFINNKINSSSELAKYNFKSNHLDFYGSDLFKSKTEGRQTILFNGDVLVESTNEAIYYLLDDMGELKKKFFVPFEPDNNYAQSPGWTRIYIKEGNIYNEQ